MLGTRWLIQAGIAAFALSCTVGCAHLGGEAANDACDACGGLCQETRYPGGALSMPDQHGSGAYSGPMGGCPEGVCQTGCQDCGQCGNGACPGCGRVGLRGRLFGWWCKRSNAIPETLPLGSTVRAHYQVMETNGEAADFIFHRHDFVGQTAQLTPDGRDKVLEIAVRMKSAPFPVLVERSENNSDPELDLLRRNVIAQLLTEYGTPDADCRTIVSPSYGRGYAGVEAEPTYYQFLSRGNRNYNNGYGAGFGGFGGIGGFGGLFGGGATGGFGGFGF